MVLVGPRRGLLVPRRAPRLGDALALCAEQGDLFPLFHEQVLPTSQGVLQDCCLDKESGLRKPGGSSWCTSARTVGRTPASASRPPCRIRRCPRTHLLVQLSSPFLHPLFLTSAVCDSPPFCRTRHPAPLSHGARQARSRRSGRCTGSASSRTSSGAPSTLSASCESA